MSSLAKTRDYKEILLPRTKRVAYVKLVSPRSARFYVPGVIDTILRRNDQGIWLLDHSDRGVIKALQHTIDKADVYSTVEELINDELSRLVNEEMFDDSGGD